MNFPQSNIPIVKDYHEQTKHHYHRYANALGYMDWASQPDPFRRFEGADLIRLSLLKEDVSPRYEDVFKKDQVKPNSLNFESISKFLEYSLALSAWKQYGDTKWALRINPSSGNLHPTEGYLILPEIAGINTLPGVYHYAPRENGLEKRVQFAKELWSLLPENIFLVGLTSIFWREVWKYGERAFRYCQHDCGHALMALDVAARMLGWQMKLVPNISDESISRLLGLNHSDAFKKDEKEFPELLAVINVNPSGNQELLDVHADFISGVFRGEWFGEANQLSVDHHHWEAIDLIGHATIKPQTNEMSREQSLEISEDISYELGLSSYQVIKKRRSAVDMDGKTSISKEQFFRMLLRVSQSFSAVPWRAKIHLGLFVHRVEGIPPGKYILVRDEKVLDELKSSMQKDFQWMKPVGCPDHLMLYCLKEDDCKDLARALSCGQDIAGDGAFSLGMIAQFDESLEQYGAWFYKRLFWETGMIGQLLYLEAEAIGVSATGIGCFFDDPVHEAFGFKDTKFQSLYHFTVGGAVVDSRLTTLSAYDRGLTP